MYHFEKKNSKIFSPEGPHENVWGPARMFPQAQLWLSTGLVLSPWLIAYLTQLTVVHFIFDMDTCVQLGFRIFTTNNCSHAISLCNFCSGELFRSLLVLGFMIVHSAYCSWI